LIDWGIVAEILKVVLGVSVGVVATYVLERRVRLIAYFGHIAEFNVAIDPTKPAGRIHTHNLIIENQGRATAHNVKVSQAYATNNIHVRPDIPYSKNTLPGGGEELVFDRLSPKEQIYISYLYVPPLLWHQFQHRVTCDETVGRFVPMQLNPVLTPLKRNLIIGLFFLGFVAAIYLLLTFAIWLFGALQ
jgi:hypothetical protein